jgi:hypothetical protein
VVLASAAKQEIRVRSGRDDNSFARVRYFMLKLLPAQPSCHPDREGSWAFGQAFGPPKMMKNGSWKRNPSSLSSRPERSAVEGPAVYSDDVKLRV